MKKLGWKSLLVLMSFSVSVGHARSIQQEIDEEARMAGPSGTTKAKVSFNRPVERLPLIHLVPIGGMTFSNFKGASGNYNFSTTSGYDAGVGILVGRGDFQFETGVMYAERGSKESFRYNFTAWDISYNNKYIELPLLARYNIINNNDVRMYVKGGAVMAVLQDSKGNVSNAQNLNQVSYSGAYYGATYGNNILLDNNTKNAFASTDLRWALGLGGQVRMTKWLAWTLEGDYQNSTSNISTSQPDAGGANTGFNLTMETYGFRTGLVFSL
jgi:hypothetical protein